MASKDPWSGTDLNNTDTSMPIGDKNSSETALSKAEKQKASKRKWAAKNRIMGKSMSKGM